MKLKISQLRQGDVIQFESVEEKERLIPLLKKEGYTNLMGLDLIVYTDNYLLLNKNTCGWMSKVFKGNHILSSKMIEAEETVVTPEQYYECKNKDAWAIGNSFVKDEFESGLLEGVFIDNNLGIDGGVIQMKGSGYIRRSRKEYIAWVQKKQEEKQIKVGDWVKDHLNRFGVVVENDECDYIEVNIGYRTGNTFFDKSKSIKITEEEARKLHDQAFEQLKNKHADEN